MAMNKQYQKPHALMLPYPLQGHVIPFVHLAIKLASNGFTITFVNTKSIHHQISKSLKSRRQSSSSSPADDDDDIFSEVRRSSPDLDIRYTTLCDGFPVEFDRSLNHDKFFESIMNDFHVRVDELVGELVVSQSYPPLNSFIVDTFYVFGSSISKKYNLFCTSFFTEPALVFTLYYHMDLLRKNGHFDVPEKSKKTITYIPGVEKIEPTDLTSYLQTDPPSVVHSILEKAFEDVKKADFVICNTIQELEPSTISALQQNQPFYAIGPIFPTEFPKSPVATSLWSESDCSTWLNGKPKGSVLYISFGSYAHTTKQEICEIANALLLVPPELNFIWVLRPDIVSSDEPDFLPRGYENIVRGRGLIVPWCFQIEVISHPAVGGFLTHCGWNSILESVWCSVPLICFPLLTDQFTNRKLVVDDWKIGLDLRGGESKSVKREEVAEKIRRLMCGKSSEEFKKAVENVRKSLENALAMDGSSHQNFGQFLKDMNTKLSKYHEENKVKSSNHTHENKLFFMSSC